MSQPPQIAGSQPPAAARVRDAIARAAQRTGVDFNYLLAQARIESGLDPQARAGTSSAAGLYQFTSGTWLATLDRHGAQHGLGWADAAIERGRVTDPALRGSVLALRHDPDIAALMAAELAGDNRDALATTLGREPDAAELYMAHFLGADGASRFLSALATTPDQSAAALMPQAAAANHGIFFDAGGSPRTVGGVMDLMRGKMAAAMGAPLPEGGYGAPVAAPSLAGGPVAQEFHAAAAPLARRPSMAETLRDTFAMGSAPDHVRAAYGKLQAFGL